MNSSAAKVGDWLLNQHLVEGVLLAHFRPAWIGERVATAIVTNSFEDTELWEDEGSIPRWVNGPLGGYLIIPPGARTGRMMCEINEVPDNCVQCLVLMPGHQKNLGKI